jgi:2-methoxy-6-polyprenyl-1,4-benzoquinol methylase
MMLRQSTRSIVRRLSGSSGTWSGSAEFGFKQASSPEDKTRMVKEVFSSVADQYDLMNDLMSVGVHRLWKDCFVNSLRLGKGMHVLDVAGGTGDIAFRCFNGLLKSERAPDLLFPDPNEDFGSVTVMDINEEMIRVGKKRAVEKGYVVEFNESSLDLNGRPSMRFVVGNAESLPFEDNSMDVYTIAFGLRNVSKIPLALSEANRVLKKGGRFSCLEFSHVNVPILDKLYEFYSFGVIPEIGKLVAGDKESYQYLVESIARFPKPEQLCEMISEAGFEKELVSYETLSGGIVAIHNAYKI